MSTVTFKFPLGVKAKCAVTGFAGLITSRMQAINGSIQYGLQPAMRKNSNFVPDALSIDEQNVEAEERRENIQFAFETGDRVKNRINGFEGFITHRVQYQNGCVSYMVEGKMKDEKEVKHKAWEQELALIDRGLNAKTEEPVNRKRTGGPHSRIKMIERAI